MTKVPSTIAESFKRSALSRFANSPAGRLARFGAGLGVVTWGYALGSAAGLVVMAAGLLPLATGALDLCVMSGLLGGEIRGARLRGQA